jgi:PqqD family protein of HPr-rel-A system
MVFLRARRNLSARIVAEEIVVFDRAGGRVHHLNPTASFVWSALDGETGSDAIAARVAERFDVETVVAGRDVRSLLEQLTALDLLEANSDGS